jgi:glutamate synthase (NADPH/NADH) large chain
VAKFILKDWENQLRHFVKVFPKEYKAVLKAAKSAPEESQQVKKS